MIKGDVIFCATGVTSGDLASGVKDLGNEFEVNTFALHKSENIIKLCIDHSVGYPAGYRISGKKFRIRCNPIGE